MKTPKHKSSSLLPLNYFYLELVEVGKLSSSYKDLRVVRSEKHQGEIFVSNRSKPISHLS